MVPPLDALSEAHCVEPPVPKQQRVRTSQPVGLYCDDDGRKLASTEVSSGVIMQIGLGVVSPSLSHTSATWCRSTPERRLCAVVAASEPPYASTTHR